MIKIAIDAMGGDHAPDEVIKGAEQSLGLKDTSLILVGNKTILQKNKKAGQFEIIHAEEVIGMNEAPVAAVKQKKNSSITRYEKNYFKI